MTREVKLKKAIINLLDRGVDAIIENDTIYVLLNDNQLELSEFEIDFQAKECTDKY